MSSLCKKLPSYHLAAIICMIGGSSTAQEVTLSDNETFVVKNGDVIDVIDASDTIDATITIDAGGVVTGFDSIEATGSQNLTIIVNGLLDSADNGIVEGVYSNPPGNTDDGDDAIVASEATGLKLSINSGAIVLTDDEFINGNGVSSSTIILRSGSQVYSEDHGIDGFGNSNIISIDGKLSAAAGEPDSGFDAIDVSDNNTINIGILGEVTAAQDGISGGNGNTVTINGQLTSLNDDTVDLRASNTVTVGSSAHVSAFDNGIEAENENTINLYGTLVSEIHGIDLGADDPSSNGGNVVVIYAGAEVRGDNVGVKFDNSANTLTVSGLVYGGTDAVLVDGNNNVIRFNDGAKIIGDLAAAADVTDNILRFDLGSTQSYFFETSGEWALEDLDGRPVVEGSAIAAGIGNVETADELMLDRAINLRNSMDRLQKQALFGLREALLDTYGASTSRTEDGTTSPFELVSQGMTVGAPVVIMGREVLPFLNYHYADLNIAEGIHDIAAQSLRIGVSVPKMWLLDHYSFGGYAVAGRNTYEGTREVLVNQDTTTGTTTVDASWGGTEIELGLNALVEDALTSRLSFKGNLGFAAQVERIGSYSEQEYFAWDNRTIIQSHVRANASLEYQVSNDTGFYGTLGAWRRDVEGGKTADYTIENTSVNYTGGIYDETVASLRLGIRHRVADVIALSAEVLGGSSTASDHTVGASFGVSAQF